MVTQGLSLLKDRGTIIFFNGYSTTHGLKFAHYQALLVSTPMNRPIDPRLSLVTISQPNCLATDYGV